MSAIINIIGQRFSSWTVLNKTDKRDSSGNIYYLCRCECGIEKIKAGRSLRNGHTKSCGCKGRKHINFEGRRFGKLIVLKQFRFGPTWKCTCKCDCGKVADLYAYNLLYKTKSCGCLGVTHKSGSLNPNWNPNLTEEDREKNKVRSHDLKYKSWSKSIKEKYNYTCQKCNKVGGILKSHHIYPWHSHHELRYDLNNGICLCETCHWTYHKTYGKHENCNPITLQEYLK